MEGVFREDDAPPAESNSRIPQWLARTLQQTGQIPSVPPAVHREQSGNLGRMPDPYQAPQSRGTTSPGRPFGGPPSLTPAPPLVDGRLPSGASAPSILPDGSMRPALGALSGGAVSRPVPPLMNIAPSLEIQPMGMGTPGALTSSGQPPAQDGMVLAQPLGPGTLLKGGRYRLIQRFHPAGVPEPQGNEPPVMLASDTEQPNGRVLIQEVLVNGAYPEDAERMRHVLAQRLEDLARGGGLPSLIDNFTERRRHFLVFELPSGEMLSDRLTRARGPLDETQAIGYALQILDVLQRFERERPPFIHGNICPANIVLRQSGQVVLVGVSATLLLHPDGVVEHGQAAGIPGYAGPEQARGQATPRSDLYSVCAVLHHMVTGNTPTPRPTPLFQPARHLNPEVSLELEEVLGQGLRPSPTQRYQSVAELRAALQPLASGRRATHVPEDLRVLANAPAPLAPVRDAKGRLMLPRRRSAQNPVVLLGTMLALIVLIGGGVLYVVSPHLTSPSAVSTATVNNFAPLYQSKGIALSGGDFVLDAQRTDNSIKQRATVALASGDTQTALSDYESAVASDQSDAEAAIYAEDLKIQLSGAAYVTVVAAVAFGAPTDTALARAELQGVFLAQQYVNSNLLLPGDLHVRVLILNSGPNAADASAACTVLLQDLQSGNAQHLVGLIGWPESQQTELAVSVLAPTGLAIVSPTADADALQGNHGNFFALVPTISQQAADLADAAVRNLSAQRILVLGDPQNPQSDAAAAAFLKEANLKADLGVVAARANFTTGVSTTKDFANLAATAVNDGDTLIFIAGSDQDSYNLAAAVTNANAAAGTTIKVLTLGDALTPALLGMGTDPLAATVRTDATPLASLDIGGFADESEWGENGVNLPRSTGFFDDYAGQFGANAEPSGLQNADAASILAYDGTRLLLAADAHAIKTDNGKITLPSPTSVRQWLLQFDASHPFQGVGGAIAFTQTGNEPNKALVILKLNLVSQPNVSAPVAQVSMLAIAGGKTAFCGSANSSCAPSV